MKCCLAKQVGDQRHCHRHTRRGSTTKKWLRLRPVLEVSLRIQVEALARG